MDVWRGFGSRTSIILEFDFPDGTQHISAGESGDWRAWEIKRCSLRPGPLELRCSTSKVGGPETWRDYGSTATNIRSWRSAALPVLGGRGSHALAFRIWTYKNRQELEQAQSGVDGAYFPKPGESLENLCECGSCLPRL